MAEQLHIFCDCCRNRLPAAERTKIRPARELGRPCPRDLCVDCLTRALAALDAPPSDGSAPVPAPTPPPTLAPGAWNSGHVVTTEAR